MASMLLLLNLIQNTSIYVLQKKESRTELDWHYGEQILTEDSFFGELTPN